VHGIVLSLSFTGREKKPAISLPAQRVTLSLSYRQPRQDRREKPEGPAPKRVEKKPETPKKISPPEKKPLAEKVKPEEKVRPRQPSPSVKAVSEPPQQEQRQEAAVTEEKAEKPNEESQPAKSELSANQDDQAEAAGVIHEARPLYRMNPSPRYPRIARERGYQGTVLLEVFVNSSGRVEELRVDSSSGFQVLDEAAISAVKGWTFEPGQRGERNVAMWVKVPVRFELE